MHARHIASAKGTHPCAVLQSHTLALTDQALGARAVIVGLADSSILISQTTVALWTSIHTCIRRIYTMLVPSSPFHKSSSTVLWAHLKIAAEVLVDTHGRRHVADIGARRQPASRRRHDRHRGLRRRPQTPRRAPSPDPPPGCRFTRPQRGGALRRPRRRARRRCGSERAAVAAGFAAQFTRSRQDARAHLGSEKIHVV